MSISTKCKNEVDESRYQPRYQFNSLISLLQYIAQRQLFVVLFFSARIFFLVCGCGDNNIDDTSRMYYWSYSNKPKESQKFENINGKLLPHGKWYKWYRNGQLASERTFNKGKLTDIMKVWYPNGQLQNLIPFNSDGKAHGELKWWTRDGKLLKTSQRKNGTGYFYIFYPDYSISSRLYFEDGNITATYYSTDGKEITIDEYLKILNKIGYVTFP